MNTLKLSAAVAVDKGHVRANNEDNIFFNGTFLSAETRDEGITYSENPDGNLIVYAVFDGMGGEAYGEEASLIASTVTAELHSKYKNLENVDANAFVATVIGMANSAICKKMSELNSGRMGATLALVAIFDNTARVYNVGDSRVYLYRNGNLSQVSIDDSYAQKLYRMGMISKEEAEVHKDRNKLTQHLGIASKDISIVPHISEDIKLVKGDRLLICSDGLTDMVPDNIIAQHLGESKVVGDITEELVCDALKNGGKDNISVILINTDEVSEPDKSKSYTLPIVLVAIAIISVIALTVGAWFIFARDDDHKEYKSESEELISEDLTENNTYDEESAKINAPLLIDYVENARLVSGGNESYLLQKRILANYKDKETDEVLKLINNESIKVLSGEEVLSVGADAILYLNGNGTATVYLEVDDKPYEVSITVVNVPKNDVISQE